MPKMTREERSARLRALGYRIVRNYRCPIRGRIVPYATLPDGRPGSTCVHQNLDDVEVRILCAEKIRAWQSEPLPEGK